MSAINLNFQNGVEDKIYKKDLREINSKERLSI